MFIKKINTIIVLAVVYTLSAGFSPPAPAGLDEIRLDILERLATKGGYEGFAARMVLAAATGDTTGLGSANLAFRAVDNRQLTESPDGYYWKWHFDIALYYLFRDSPSILYPK
ncbi:MAG: hypothetical protein U9P14_11975, partial [Gemmatimonadota bacterium]|nr:hypothetical protein [Gemmatimonadota bacterium]